MARAAENDDDLSMLMPKSVQGLKPSESAESESQALREYLDLQNEKVQQNELAAAVPHEVFLPAYNRRRDRPPNQWNESRGLLPASPLKFTGRKAAADPFYKKAGEKIEGAWDATSGQNTPKRNAFQLVTDENAPPLELLPTASKQRKTEREERKQKGKARGFNKRPFGLDLKQHPRKEHTIESESDWKKLEGQLATVHTERRQAKLVDGQSKGGEVPARRRGWVAARRKSLLQSKSEAELKSPGLVKGQEDKDGGLHPSDEKLEDEENSGSRGNGDLPGALATELVRRARKPAAGINGLFWPRSSLQQEGQETRRPVQSSEGTMMDAGLDMEIDESDEEVEGPLKRAEEIAGGPQDDAQWTFNPLFGGPDATEHLPQVKPPPPNTTAEIEAPETASPLPVNSTEAQPPNTPQTFPPDKSNFPKEVERARIVSPLVSQAASNLVSPSQGVRKSPSLDTDGEEAQAAAALAEMDLGGGFGIAAAAAPQEEEIDFPALEGSPPPVAPVETSEGEENNSQNPFGLAVAERSIVPQAEELQPQQTGRGKKNKRLMLLHGRTSLADAGLRTEHGVRRTTRARIRPLEFWRNETVVYERSHNSLPTIARVVTLSPDPLWPRPEGREAFRLQRKKLKELGQAEEVLTLSMS
ncbi:hypothetical protein KFL_002910070 [Klebsormidium nitens]|uniref:Uncharacterized protein n=1 Tax=Klebsormidium nitens TaxID=105231 RepID=A0A1Y1IAL4_KLENI|nr:hypothetical protein KFL_002910070 [Klebsormidium nitens]|eukprot:GAQ86469.1 hypothetical protein KFL_002910070 [Klebsormidium nitens]